PGAPHRRDRRGQAVVQRQQVLDEAVGKEGRRALHRLVAKSRVLGHGLSWSVGPDCALHFARRVRSCQGGEEGNPARVPLPKEGKRGTLRGCPYPRRGRGEPCEGAPTQGGEEGNPARVPLPKRREEGN